MQQQHRIFRGQCAVMIALGLAAALNALLLGAVHAASDDFPQRPIRWLVPYGAGSSSDLTIRSLTPRLSKAVNQQWVVENRPGGAGNVAAQAAVNATPDGYTVFLGSSASHAANPHLQASLPYDPFKDFLPVSGLVSYGFVLVTSGSEGSQSTGDLVKRIKASAHPMPYASSGVATSSHIIGLAFARELGVELTHVPYNNPSQAFIELLTGKTEMMFYVFNALDPFIKSGKLRAVATTGATRAPYLPNVPTMQETGFPGFVWTSWMALHAPKGTPAPAVEKLYRAVVEAQQDRQVIDGLLAQGVQMMPMSPTELDQFARSENERYRKLFAAVGIKPQ